MGKNCSDCAPCLSGLPCGGHTAAQGMVGMQGYGGVRRITNWGNANMNSTAAISAWIASDSKDLSQLAQIIEQDMLNDSLSIDAYDKVVALGKEMKEGTLSKISYLNQVETILKPLGSSQALVSVTTVLTHCRRKAIMYGGGAMIGGILLSGGVSMTENQMDNYLHILSVLGFGYGGYTLAKAYGVI